MKLQVVIILSSFLVTGCQTRVVPISKRDYVNQSSGAEIYKKGRKIQDGRKDPPQIFMKKKSIRIKPVSKTDNNGSLFSSDNPENYLFYDKPRGEVGDMIPILVRVNQAEGGAAGGGGAQGELEAGQIKDELLAALPEFTPRDDESNILPLTSIKFKVDRRLPNGDLIVSTYRTSKNETQSSTIRVKARIERATLMAKKDITTEDLLDVDWYQRKDGEVIERDSLSWQDEYTLRMSGFDEAKSKMAQQLETKREDLKKVRDRLRDRINSLGKERRQFAQSRQKLDQEKKKLSDTIQEYDNKISEQNNTIEEQKSIIKRQQDMLDQLQNETESPGDERGAADAG
ncbi:flagellar basal body L-ring protein FlgH [Pseudobacteriovorax antillogorgiicola]|uniref:L-ring protein n=1 Tax=Pseudobacteriovorax antillogorgiicola TaxID=1513793 RepID=A0A1Y6B8R2_9BACT|nr:flagellar basal body L-ring protein FlgH [Pseudobacteriovorax antillogorgiicola]TCS59527.1 L-ring protein [Pseudobacteriovorax antillogorgiicola]SME87834.1 L-ring protein [Pseudobacteriovorax antillogorgiicola]